MMHTNHKKGFSFIEVIFSLTLLSVFGTSLFMVQSSLFSQISKAHQSVLNLLSTNKALIDFNLKLLASLKKKDLPENISIKNFDEKTKITTTAQLENIPKQSKLFKTFHETIKYISIKNTTDHGKIEKLVQFAFIDQQKENDTK